jgi:predicted dehydrogenase
MVRKVALCILAVCLTSVLTSCTKREEGQSTDVAANGIAKLIVLNPGHYHAALVQKTMYNQVDHTVHVYAPSGPEGQEYLKRIDSFNNRPDNSTNWEQKVYTGDDYLKKMLAERSGNVVVISGNNQKKTEYIKSAIDAGLNVFSDKPMCIDAAGFRLLEEAFASADKNSVLLYDIMTERFNIFHILQKMLVLNKDVFGELQKGSVAEPAVVKESVHHFFKYVSGTPIKRPTWYFDTAQQGEGLVDVTTHLIDLVMWTCFPEQAIDYRRDVVMKRARRWPTMITRQQYVKVTRAPDFPDFLKGKLNDEGVLPYYANGEMVYVLKGIHVRLSVTWDFQAPEGAGDTQYSLFTGSKARVLLKQGQEQGYRPQLYVEPAGGISLEHLRATLDKAIADVQSTYPGLALKRGPNCWQVLIPDEHQSGHEAHFRKVTERYLLYLAETKLPQWEVSNMIAKYYITTTALQSAQQ